MSVFINNLDDYILPSQDCVNPLILSKKRDASVAANSSSSSSSSSRPSNKIMLVNDDTISEYEAPIKPITEPNLINTKYDSNNQKIASVSLNDCLACSGCITSAEAILIQEQSSQKFLEILRSNEKIVVVSLSPQSVASLAGFLDLSQIETFLKIATFFKSLGVYYVLDTSAGGDISLIESRREFMERSVTSFSVVEGDLMVSSRKNFGKGTQWTRPPTSVAYSNSRVIIPTESADVQDFQPVPLSELQALTLSTYHQDGLAPFAPLPMFCSHCPGWICYAEKTQPQCLPYISTVKSPQQIIGSIFKHILTQPLSSIASAGSSSSSFSVDELLVQHGDYKPWAPDQVFHVSIQPCFDKKLEASRLDFYDEESDVQDVDLVISSSELWLLIEQTYVENFQKDQNLTAIQYFKSLSLDLATGRDSIEALFRSFSKDSSHILSAATSHFHSNGYAEYLFRYLAKKLYSIDLSNQEIHYVTGRNQDIAEAVLYSNGTTISQESDHSSSCSVPLMRFARLYGFRNIQGVILKMKRMKCDYDYVEIMACPSGCVNGGGQIKLTATESPAEIQTRVTKTSLRLHSDLVLKTVEESPLVRSLYSCSGGEKKLTSGGEGEGGECELVTSYSQYFRTQYHAIPKLELMAPMAAKW